MKFEKEKVFTIVTAEEAPEGMFGYFSNDIASLKTAVNESKTNRCVTYGKLEGILCPRERARFYTNGGQLIFALFYPLEAEHNMNRY